MVCSSLEVGEYHTWQSAIFRIIVAFLMQQGITWLGLFIVTLWRIADFFLHTKAYEILLDYINVVTVKLLTQQENDREQTLRGIQSIDHMTRSFCGFWLVGWEPASHTRQFGGLRCNGVRKRHHYFHSTCWRLHQRYISLFYQDNKEFLAGIFSFFARNAYL